VPEKIAAPDDGRQGVVLLVEDDPDVAAYTGLVLRRLAGARVIDAASADAALAALAAEDVDVVITDIDLLPGANGLELTGIVRERFPLLPLVVLSGHATFDHAVVATRRRGRVPGQAGGPGPADDGGHGDGRPAPQAGGRGVGLGARDLRAPR
jgi:CheY-like chemotaxis protein